MHDARSMLQNILSLIPNVLVSNWDSNSHECMAVYGSKGYCSTNTIKQHIKLIAVVLSEQYWNFNT
jgi:hypothetical protein